MTFAPQFYYGLGCHTATMIVSHLFDDQTHCPVCTDDFSAITWHFVICPDLTTCTTTADISGCLNLHNDCPAVQAALVDAGAAPACPETTTGSGP